MHARPSWLRNDRLNQADRVIRSWFGRVGHPFHRVTLGLFFIWMGLLKQYGHPTGSSLLAHTVYFGSPEMVVPLLGWWEAAIGMTLLHPATVRVSILLLLIRLPSTMLALILKHDVCFRVVPWVPTPEGQYIIKDMLLFGAAMVIGGSLSERPRITSRANHS